MEYLWYALIYSFFGYCFEKVFAFVTHSPRQIRRCFLVLPLCPVYGFAMLAVILAGTAEIAVRWERILFGGMIATAVEYAVHWAYETLLGVQFWDYSDTKMDVNGRVCLPFSIAWGLLGAAALRFVQPQLASLAAALPDPLLELLLFAAAIDGIYTVRVLLLTHDTEQLTLRKAMKRKRAA